MVLDHLNATHRELNFHLWAFEVMPEHLLIHPLWAMRHPGRKMPLAQVGLAKSLIPFKSNIRDHNKSFAINFDDSVVQ